MLKLGVAWELLIEKCSGVSEEIRDPRLYSNLRGGFTGESAEERVKAHKKLSKLKGGKQTVWRAMKSGWGRRKLQREE